MATAACAIVVGLAGGLIARFFMINPVITAVAGVTPFLPGSGVYRGMYAIMNEQLVVGMTNLIVAVGTCMALAAWRRLRRVDGAPHPPPAAVQPLQRVQARRAADLRADPPRGVRGPARDPTQARRVHEAHAPSHMTAAVA